MVDNQDMQVFLHEFSHHMEDVLKATNPQLHARLNEWYETLFKDKHPNFSEFFADFLSDAFLRRNDEYAEALKKNGLEGVRSLQSVYKDAWAFFKAIVRRFYEAFTENMSGKANHDIAKKSAEALFDIILRDMTTIVKKDATTVTADFTTSTRWEQVASKIALSKMEGTNSQKHSMLAQALAQLHYVLTSSGLSEAIKRTPDEHKNMAMSKIFNQVITGSIVLKKVNVKGKQVIVNTRPWNMDKILTDTNWIKFIEAAEPIFNFIRRDSKLSLWTRHPEFAKKAVMALNTLKGSGAELEGIIQLNKLLDDVDLKAANDTLTQKDINSVD